MTDQPTSEQVERGAIALAGVNSSLPADEAWEGMGQITQERMREMARAVLVAALSGEET